MAQRNFKSESDATTAKNLQSALRQRRSVGKAYHRRLEQPEYDCMVELIEVLAQHTIIGTNSSDGL